MNVNRGKLIDQLVAKGYTKQSAKSIVEDFTQVIIDNLREGNTVSLRDFGVFSITARKARVCLNPQTGEKVNVPEHYIPHFSPSKYMKIAVKEYDDEHRRGVI